MYVTSTKGFAQTTLSLCTISVHLSSTSPKEQLLCLFRGQRGLWKGLPWVSFFKRCWTCWTLPNPITIKLDVITRRHHDPTCGRIWSVPLSISTLAAEPFGLWPWYLAWGWTLTLVRLGLKVKVNGQRSRSNDKNRVLSSLLPCFQRGW